LAADGDALAAGADAGPAGRAPRSPPPFTDERSRAATSGDTVEEWLFTSTPMVESLESRSFDGTPSSLASS
jgi:hypothetical protein